MEDQGRIPYSIHRRLLLMMIVCWLLFTTLFMIGNANEVLENDMNLFVAVVLAPILPLIRIPGAIATGNFAESLLLIVLQFIPLLPWLACARRSKYSMLRCAAFTGVALYWIVIFLHL
jgi:hypothetical protein